MSQEEQANEIVHCLCKEGWPAYITGGAARDMLMGKTPADFDIVTEAPYHVIVQLFRKRGAKVKTVGASFKVALVNGIEVATYRSDRTTGHEMENLAAPEAKTLEEDLSRRDLTINSMGWCPYTGELIDPHSGLRDLKAGRIRFTGDPGDRIREDPCRIIRACRFLAKIKGQFEPDTFQALSTYKNLVKTRVAPERIRLELIKAMGCDKPSLFFKAMLDIGILENVFPSLCQGYGHGGGPHHGETVWEHSMMAGDFLPKTSWLLRLTGFLHDVGKPEAFDKATRRFLNHEKIGGKIVEQELNRLRFSSNEIHYVKNLTRYHMRTMGPELTPKGIRRFLKVFEEEEINWKDWIRLKIADRRANLKSRNYTARQIKRFVLMIHHEKRLKRAVTIKRLAVNGDDIMGILNCGPGAHVGRILQRLVELTIDDPDLNTKEELTKLILKYK